MSGSSALVALNALMLKRTKLAGIKPVPSSKERTETARVASEAAA